jgi:prefoldin beta subunit
MSQQELPPWLREQLSRLQQLQQNLQAIMMQKQQVELEVVEIDRALDELRKLEGNDASVYKSAGPLLIKTNKDDVLKELEEKKELSNTRLTVLGKQETRVKDNLKEVENKINTMIRQMQAGGSSSIGAGPGFGTPSGGQGVGGPGGGGFGTRPQGQ